MKVSSIVLCAALLMPALLPGSSNAAGPRQTMLLSAIAYNKQGIVHGAKEHLRDTTDALSVTPRVKEAIIADPQLNNKHNLINVGTRDYVVHLRGHVYSGALKARAGRIAARKLNKMHKNYRVSNELRVVRR